MITFADVKASPDGWEDDMPNANEPMPKFELALAELIDGYRGKLPRDEMLDALLGQRDRVEADWPEPKLPTDDPEAA